MTEALNACWASGFPPHSPGCWNIYGENNLMSWKREIMSYKTADCHKDSSSSGGLEFLPPTCRDKLSEWKWLQSSISLVWWSGNKHLTASNSFQDSFCHYCPFQFRRVKSCDINAVRFSLNLQSILASQVTILSKFYMLSPIFFSFHLLFSFLSPFIFFLSFFFTASVKCCFDW